MTNSVIAISFQKVSKSFDLQPVKRFRIGLQNLKKTFSKELVLKGIDLEIKQGETIGLYGANGSGKSTILRLMAGILLPDHGQVVLNPQLKVAAVIELGSGLHPDLTGIENIELYGSILGLSPTQRMKVTTKIIEFSGLKEKIKLPIQKYSSGMKARLAFSIMAFSGADVLLLDEVFAVGDVEFLDKSRALLEKFKYKKTIIISSHNLQMLQGFCERIIKLKNGAIDQSGKLYELLFELSLGEKFSLKVISNSMYPLIKRGDMIQVMRVALSSVKPDNVVAVYFRNIQEIVIHRVLAKNKDGELILRGDNNFAPDQWVVGKNNFLGQVLI